MLGQSQGVMDPIKDVTKAKTEASQEKCSEISRFVSTTLSPVCTLDSLGDA